MMLENELVTGRGEFDDHHARLLNEIDQLRGICKLDTTERVCSRCSDATQLSCRNDLHRFGRAFAGIWLRETKEEERLLRSLPVTDATAGPIDAHLQGHADISDLIVTATSTDLEQGLLVIFDELPVKIRHHIVECDRWLAAQLKAPGGD